MQKNISNVKSIGFFMLMPRFSPRDQMCSAQPGHFFWGCLIKWFEHETTAHNDIKLKRLKKIFGIEGIGAWWTLCEIVGLEGTGGYLELAKYPLEDLSVEWGISLDKTESLINAMGDIGLLQKPLLPNAIHIPKLLDRADEYTKKQEREARIHAERTKSRQNRDISRQSPSAQSDVHTLLSFFINKYKEYIGTGYSPNWGRDGKLMKELLLAHSKDDLIQIIEEFFVAAQNPDVWWADKVSIPILKTCAHDVVGRIRKKGIKT